MSTLLLVALDFKSDEPITEPCVYRMKGHSASQRVRFVPLPSRPPRALSLFVPSVSAVQTGVQTAPAPRHWRHAQIQYEANARQDHAVC